MNIKGLNKAEVLKALYDNSKPLGMCLIHFEPGDMTISEAESILNNGCEFFDYLKGRVMKVDISGDDLKTFLYNRDNGAGAAERALENLKPVLND